MQINGIIENGEAGMVVMERDDLEHIRECLQMHPTTVRQDLIADCRFMLLVLDTAAEEGFPAARRRALQEYR